MKLSLKTLIDPEKAALAKARFHAWWEGESFDASAFAAARAGDAAGSSDAAFDAAPVLEPPAPDPRLSALEILWGPNRIGPGDDHEDRLQPARLGLSATATLAVFGPGLAGPVLAAGEAHPGTIQAFEWREEALAHLTYGLATKLPERSAAQALDLDLYSAAPDAWDGVWSLDEFTYAPNPTRLALQMFKGLKPGASAVLEFYVTEGRMPVGSAFAAAFAEPHLTQAGELEPLLAGAGLALEETEDLTADHLTAAKEGFRRLERALSAAAALEPGVAREIAWEAESWAHRMAALNAGKLKRRRLVVRKPD